jgi:hypothetical protein
MYSHLHHGHFDFNSKHLRNDNHRPSVYNQSLPIQTTAPDPVIVGPTVHLLEARHAVRVAVDRLALGD